MPRPTDAPPTPSRRTKRRGGSQQRSRSKPIAPTSDVIVAASHTPREAGQGTDLGLSEHVDVPVAAPVLLCRGPTRPLACPGTASAAAPRHVVRATLLPSSRADAGCGGQGTAVPVLCCAARWLAPVRCAVCRHLSSSDRTSAALPPAPLAFLGRNRTGLCV